MTLEKTMTRKQLKSVSFFLFVFVSFHLLSTLSFSLIFPFSSIISAVDVQSYIFIPVYFAKKPNFHLNEIHLYDCLIFKNIISWKLPYMTEKKLLIHYTSIWNLSWALFVISYFAIQKHWLKLLRKNPIFVSFCVTFLAFAFDIFQYIKCIPWRSLKWKKRP